VDADATELRKLLVKLQRLVGTIIKRIDSASD
jgi:hypothetical protein